MIDDELVKRYEGYIHLAIKRLHIYWRTEEEHQEYIDSGYDGLINGIRGYDPTKGFKPSTYIYKCIETELKKRIYLNTMQKRTTKVISLNIEAEDIELIELIPDTKDIEKEVMDKIRNEKLNKLVNTILTGKDRYVIKMLYGLDGWEQIGVCEIARRWGVSKSAITFRKNKALKKLLEEIKKDGL